MARELGLSTLAMAAWGAFYCWLAGRWPEGREVLDEAARDDRVRSGRSDGLRIAEALYDATMGRFDRAEASLEAAMRNEPEDPAPLVIMSELCLWRGDPTGAIAAATAALELAPLMIEQGDRTYRAGSCGSSPARRPTAPWARGIDGRTTTAVRLRPGRTPPPHSAGPSSSLAIGATGTGVISRRAWPRRRPRRPAPREQRPRRLGLGCGCVGSDRPPLRGGLRQVSACGGAARRGSPARGGDRRPAARGRRRGGPGSGAAPSGDRDARDPVEDRAR